MSMPSVSQPYTPWILGYKPWQRFRKRTGDLLELPAEGPTYYTYSKYRDQRMWGGVTMMMFLSELCLEWWNRNSWQSPLVPRIGMGELSLKSGHAPKGHSSHHDGLAIDIAVFNRDRQRERDDRKRPPDSNIVDWRMTGRYDRTTTRHLIQTMFDVVDGKTTASGRPRYRIAKKGPGNRFYYNDPVVRAQFGGRLAQWDNHDEHIHIRLEDENPIGPVPAALLIGKTMPEIDLFVRDMEQLLAKVGMLLSAGALAMGGVMGLPVKILQAVLNRRGNTVLPFLAVDGAFGPKTKARVCEFQRHCGLVSDGIVGPKTKAKLAA
jgi:hypothetical protein